MEKSADRGDKYGQNATGDGWPLCRRRPSGKSRLK
jgi:hypothetical protein